MHDDPSQHDIPRLTEEEEQSLKREELRDQHWAEEIWANDPSQHDIPRRGELREQHLLLNHPSTVAGCDLCFKRLMNSRWENLSEDEKERRLEEAEFGLA